MNWTKVMRWQLFGRSCRVGKIGVVSAKEGWTVEKYMFEVLFVWKLPVLPKNEIVRILIFLLCYACWIELWKSVERLKSYGGTSVWKFPVCCPKMEFEKLLMLPRVSAIVELNPSMYCVWESVERVKRYSTGCFGLKAPCLGMKFRRNLMNTMEQWSCC
jgi:hypothetical protein